MRLRWLWSLGVWFLLTTTVIATAGLAGGPGGDESFATAPSRVGDRAMYKTALVVVEGDEGTWFDMNARYAFERLQDRWIDTADGLRPARSFVSEWRAEEFRFSLGDFVHFEFPSCVDDLTGPGVQWGNEDPSYWSDYEDAWDDCGDAIDDWADDVEDWAEDMGSWDTPGAGPWMAGDWASSTHRVEAGDWRVTHHDAVTHASLAVTRPAGDATHLPAAVTAIEGAAAVAWTVPSGLPGPCGFAHDMQGTPADVWGRLTMHGACPPAMEFGFARTAPRPAPVVLAVSGDDRVGDWQTTVFADADEPDALRVWLSPEVPYPVRILTRVDVVPPDWVKFANNGAPPRFYILHEMIEFEAGDVATAPGPQPAVADVLGPRQVWGASDGGVRHDWPLSAAWMMALHSPNSDLEAWLRTHPDAAVDDTSFAVTPMAAGRTNLTWMARLSDGQDAFVLHASRHSVGGRPSTTATYAFSGTAMQATGQDARDQPAQVPDARAAMERFEAMTGLRATGYTYHALCTVPCDDAAILAVGIRPQWGGDDTRLMLFDHTGAWRGTGDPQGTYPPARFTDATWDPSRAGPGWQWSAMQSGAWSWPEPRTAAGITAITGLVSLLYFLWPVLKGAGVGMFSRIRHEDLLDHPVRQDMFDVVRNNPGIHFQELVRRLAKGRGTTEHHIRKMVAAGLLVEKTAQGYTCYFPKGLVDRHLMAAAPALKSVGARQVLQAIHQQPGAFAQDLAQRLGMAPSTVNYHLKKLTSVGLVDATRQGRSLALHATPLGDQALGTFQT